MGWLQEPAPPDQPGGGGVPGVAWPRQVVFQSLEGLAAPSDPRSGQNPVLLLSSAETAPLGTRSPQDGLQALSKDRAGILPIVSITCFYFHSQTEAVITNISPLGLWAPQCQS